MNKESIQQESRLIKIKLLPQLTIGFALVTGIIFLFSIIGLVNLEKQKLDNWIDKSIFSSLDAIDNIYASTKNDEYDVEFVWGKLMADFDNLGLLENGISVEELNTLKQNLRNNIENTIYASFNHFIKNLRFQINGFPFVVSQTGEVLIHPSDKGKNYADKLFFQNVISSNTFTGELNIRWPENRLGEEMKLFYKINNENNNISFVSLNNDDYTGYLKLHKTNIILFGTAVYILTILLFILIINPLISGFKKQKKNIELLINEHKFVKLKTRFNNEINHTNIALHESQNYLNQLHGFIEQLKNQKYDTSSLKNTNNKLLAKDLTGLTEGLVKIQEEENRRKEELDTQNWIATGVAKFNDVLRKSSNLKEMGYDIVSSLCDYMNINQAAIYTVKRDERTSEINTIKLIAAYAFDRHRTVEKILEPGEGLVGAAIKETKSLYLDNIPKDYINITSGLGEALPSHLLILPLKKEEEILGALELASFNKLKKHEIEFLERLSETFAISISNILVSDNTNKLLNETKEQAEQMASQEEEMRQTLEELQATQEEMQRKTKQMEEMNKLHEEKELELENKIAELEKREVELTNLIQLKEKEIKNLKPKQ